MSDPTAPRRGRREWFVASLLAFGAWLALLGWMAATSAQRPRDAVGTRAAQADAATGTTGGG